MARARNGASLGRGQGVKDSFNEQLGIKGFCTNSFPLNPIPRRDSEEKKINGWVSHAVFEFIFVATVQGEQLRDQFFCDKCQAWRGMNDSVGNMHRHLQSIHAKEWAALTASNSDPVLRETITNPEHRKMQMTQYIVQCCEAFRKVEELPFREVFGISMTRKEVKDRVLSMRTDLMQRIIRMLRTTSNIVISLDEWSDAKSEKYLGVHAYTVISNKYVNLCLEHISLTGNQSSSAELGLLLEKILGTKYHVEQKVKLYLFYSYKYAVTDNASVMIATIEAINLHRMPCFCHVLNLMSSDLLKEINIDELLDFLAAFSKSSRFTSFLQSSKAKYSSIPTYTPTRCFSLFKTVRNSMANRGAIDSFISKERLTGRSMSPIAQTTWDSVAKLNSVLPTFRYTCKKLEGDESGSRSHVWQAFALLQNCCKLDSTLKAAFLVAERTHWSKFMTAKVRTIVAITCILNPSVSLKFTPEHDINLGRAKISQEISAMRPATPTTEAPKKRDSPESQSLMTFSDVEDNDEEQTGELELFLTLNRKAISHSTRTSDCSSNFDLLQSNCYQGGSVTGRHIRACTN
jgi:hypothetical protein